MVSVQREFIASFQGLPLQVAIVCLVSKWNQLSVPNRPQQCIRVGINWDAYSFLFILLSEQVKVIVFISIISSGRGRG